MKKIWFSLLVVLATTVVAQDRIDEKPTSLTYKSKEIRYALFGSVILKREMGE